MGAAVRRRRPLLISQRLNSQEGILHGIDYRC